MSDDISISFIKWIWKPCMVCTVDISFPAWTVRGWSIVQFPGEEGFMLIPPSQRIYDQDSKHYNPIIEWHDPSHEIRFKERIAELIKEKSNIDLNDKGQMEYFWYLTAKAIRKERVIESKYGFKKLPPSMRR